MSLSQLMCTGWAGGGGGCSASSLGFRSDQTLVERATHGQEIVDSIPALGCPLPTGWFGVIIM